jgi:hypothetical protein
VYRLDSPALDLRDKYTSNVIEVSREAYVSALYEKIEKRWLSSDGDAAEFAEELRDFGVQLLDELVPKGLQAVLWRHRRELQSIQVVAEEPFIPWELVHLREPGGSFPPEPWFLACGGCLRVAGRRIGCGCDLARRATSSPTTPIPGTCWVRRPTSARSSSGGSARARSTRSLARSVS